MSGVDEPGGPAAPEDTDPQPLSPEDQQAVVEGEEAAAADEANPNSDGEEAPATDPSLHHAAGGNQPLP